jgi:hypothetical protein
VVDGAPEVVELTVDLHEDLVEMPAPVGVLAHGLNPLPADLRGLQADLVFTMALRIVISLVLSD